MSVAVMGYGEVTGVQQFPAELNYLGVVIDARFPALEIILPNTINLLFIYRFLRVVPAPGNSEYLGIFPNVVGGDIPEAPEVAYIRGIFYVPYKTFDL